MHIYTCGYAISASYEDILYFLSVEEDYYDLVDNAQGATEYKSLESVHQTIQEIQSGKWSVYLDKKDITLFVAHTLDIIPPDKFEKMLMSLWFWTSNFFLFLLDIHAIFMLTNIKQDFKRICALTRFSGRSIMS